MTDTIFKLLTALFVSGCFICLPAFGQNDDAEKLKQLNEKIVTAIRTNDFRSAEDMSKESVSLATKLNGQVNRDVAIAYMNMAFSQKQQSKFSQAVQNFSAAIDILKQLSDNKNKDLFEAYSSRGHTYFAAGKSKEAISDYQQAITEADRVFGADSGESYLPNFNIAQIKLKQENWDQSHSYYVNAYRIGLLRFGLNSPEVEKIEDTIYCSALDDNLSSKQRKTFSKLRWQHARSQGLDYGVLNGKALSLPIPFYPPRASQLNIQGKVVVRVLVDETGKTSVDKVVCGSYTFRSAAVEAAREAKFAPTIINGKAVTVSGIILYNFRR